MRLHKSAGTHGQRHTRHAHEMEPANGIIFSISRPIVARIGFGTVQETITWSVSYLGDNNRYRKRQICSPL